MDQAPLDDAFVVILRKLLIEDGRFQEARREWGLRDAPGVREWVHRHAMEQERKTIDRGVEAAGGWQAVCKAVFGDRDEAWREAKNAPQGAMAGGNPAPVPHWIVMDALHQRRTAR